MNDHDGILFDLCMALRKVPRGILRDLGKRRFPPDDLPEKIVAEAIVEHLELCGWSLEQIDVDHRIPPPAAARSRQTVLTGVAAPPDLRQSTTSRRFVATSE